VPCCTPPGKRRGSLEIRAPGDNAQAWRLQPVRTENSSRKNKRAGDSPGRFAAARLLAEVGTARSLARRRVPTRGMACDETNSKPLSCEPPRQEPGPSFRCTQRTQPPSRLRHASEIHAGSAARRAPRRHARPPKAKSYGGNRKDDPANRSRATWRQARFGREMTRCAAARPLPFAVRGAGVPARIRGCSAFPRPSSLRDPNSGI